MSIPYAPDRRLDMYPYHDLVLRLRYFGIEILLMTCFTVCTAPAEPLGRQPPVEICSDPFDCLAVLNRWVLFAYMCHVPFLRMLPVPFSYICVYACIAAFYAEDKLLQAFRQPGAPEVFSYAWLVILVPF